jgi:hypothetical protein
MGTFADSVKLNCDKKIEEVSKKVESITRELFQLVVNSTPVLDGYLINSWHTAKGMGEYSWAMERSPDSFGSGSKADIDSLLATKPFYATDNIVSMTNNLPYAYRIEYLGWSKFKAPTGMVRISLQQVAARHK